MLSILLQKSLNNLKREHLLIMIKKKKQYIRYRERLKKYSEYGTLLEGKCPFCGEDCKFYYYRYDAVCCLYCDTWLEKACGDPNCTYCRNRPDSPLEGLFNEDRTAMYYQKECLRLKYQHRQSGKIRHEKRKNHDG